jgi:hypothetical protein
VLIEEPQQRLGGELAAAIRRERPQRGGERHREAVAQLAAGAAAHQVVVERCARREPAGEVAGGAAHEAEDLDDEPPVPAIEQPAAIGEHRAQARAAPLEVVAVAGDRDGERHRRRPRRDAELPEHREERR